MAVPPAGEGPQPQHDLQAQVAALLALGLQGRCKSERPPITSIVAGLAALFAAVASALGAVYSLYAAVQVSDTQRDIQARQQQIEARQEQLARYQERLDREARLAAENTRIGNLHIHTGRICGPIPLDDADRWRRYCACLSADESCGRGFDPEPRLPRRLECATEVGMCSADTNP